MKSCIKKIIVFSVMCLGSVTYGASINQSFADGSSSPDLGVVNGTGLVENTSATVNAGDTLSFSLNYNLNEGLAALELRAFLEDMRGRTFTAGTTETVTGHIESSNHDNSDGSVTVQFNDTVQLTWMRTSWQKQDCSAHACASSLLGGATDVLSPGGLDLGDVENTNAYYKGGLVVEFSVDAVTQSDCALSGVTVAHGDSAVFYSDSSPTDSCSSVSVVRTCANGALSGSSSYNKSSCERERTSLDVCILDGITLSHNQSRRFYSQESLKGESCDTVDRLRTCNDGNLSGSSAYRYATCATEQYANCSLDGVTIYHGTSYQAYSSQQSEESCDSIVQERTCSDGELSGAAQYRYLTCLNTVATQSNCKINGVELAHGASRTFYSVAQTSGSCSAHDQVRTCDNGVLSGSNEYYLFQCSVLPQIETQITSTITAPQSVTKKKIVTRPTVPVIEYAEPAKELRVTKWVSGENEPRFDTQIRATPGETVYYKVLVENTTGLDLRDVEVIDRIPFELELDTNQSADDDDEKQIRWVTDLGDGESKTYITEMRVREDTSEGDAIDSYASAENDDFDHDSNVVEIQITEDYYGPTQEIQEGDEVVVPLEYSNKSGFWGWIWWLILIVALLFLLRWVISLYWSHKKHRLLIAQMQRDKDQQ